MLRNEHVTQCHTLPAGRERAASALAGRMVGNGADETLGPVEGSLCRDNAPAVHAFHATGLVPSPAPSVRIALRTCASSPATAPRTQRGHRRNSARRPTQVPWRRIQRCCAHPQPRASPHPHLGGGGPAQLGCVWSEVCTRVALGTSSKTLAEYVAAASVTSLSSRSSCPIAGSSYCTRHKAAGWAGSSSLK